MAGKLQNFACPQCTAALMAKETFPDGKAHLTSHVEGLETTMTPIQGTPGSVLLTIHCPKCGAWSPGPIMKLPAGQ